MARAGPLDEGGAAGDDGISTYPGDVATRPANLIPMHPGAMKYYRERGYVK